MSEPATSGFARVDVAPLGPGDGATVVLGPAGDEVEGRSPGQLAWARLRRDRVAMASAGVIAVAVVVVLAAPVIGWLYGDDPTRGHTELLDSTGYPLGYAGGTSADHWLGLTVGRGYDLFLQLIYGARTSLGIAVAAAVACVGSGAVIGAIAGYAGGWADRALVWVIDLFLAFPFYLFAIALVPVVSSRLADEYGEVAVWKRVVVIIALFTVFNWSGTARIVRGQVLSLRERDYVAAARAAGAGPGHIIFREILPNVWAPILVMFSLLVPALVTLEAALSFLSIGVPEPVPDLGRLILQGAGNVSNISLVPWVVLVPALSLFVLVLAFNLLGDAVRDALDPRSTR